MKLNNPFVTSSGKGWNPIENRLVKIFVHFSFWAVISVPCLYHFYSQPMPKIKLSRSNSRANIKVGLISEHANGWERSLHFP